MAPTETKERVGIKRGIGFALSNVMIKWLMIGTIGTYLYLLAVGIIGIS
jgi:hypothetical protein